MTKVTSKGIKVTLSKTEKIRKMLLEKDLIRSDLKISKNKKHTVIPIKNDKDIELNEKDYEIVEKEFSKSRKTVHSYKDLLNVPNEIYKELPTSYDVIGDIALIKISKNLREYKFKIGNAILKANKNIKTVCNIESVSGELRTRDVEIISGEKKTETVHKEYGTKFYVDIEKVYFSPRLANERKRISELVKDSEIILDMFTGVAPFPVIINKFSNQELIYGIDKNKKAIDLAKKNVRVNKAYEKVKLICGDSRKIKKLIPSKIKFDRIIMNLPFSSYKFLKYVFQVAKDECILHLYEFIDENKINDRKKELKKTFSKNSFTCKNIKVNKIKSYTPREFYICFDITAKKKSS